ncbi:general substrate transporter [Alternaria alternata]|nr:general substrate transporter [Alternaria alternata]
MAKLQETTLWANRKCLIICSAVAIASMQYGIDTAAVGGLQAMPGFLMVFGYEEPASPLGYGIDAGAVSLQIGSTSNTGLYVGRLFLGFSNGFFVVFSTVYCSEAAPAHLREHVSCNHLLALNH